VKRTHKFVVMFFSLVVLLSTLSSTASAGTLIGHIRFLYADVPNGTATVHIYNGPYCGSVTLSGIGLPTSDTTAYNAFLAVLTQGPPFSPQHMVVVNTSGPAGICNRTTDPITTFYINY
jgi:hypothetical protein